jgi:hypothetical protein
MQPKLMPLPPWTARPAAEEVHQLMKKCWSRLKHKAKKANPQR